jgi:hypothetical protein
VESEQKTPEEATDERAGEPPAESGPEQVPKPEGNESPGEDPLSSSGPYGNPETDEETLRKKQEERGA